MHKNLLSLFQKAKILCITKKQIAEKSSIKSDCHGTYKIFTVWTLSELVAGQTSKTIKIFYDYFRTISTDQTNHGPTLKKKKSTRLGSR